MSYKRFYIIGSLSILGILTLIAPFIDYYYGYEDNIYCTDTCFVEFCLKNGNKNLYFYNKEELPLTFYPDGKVSNVKFFKKDGRYKSGYREIDFINPYSKGVLYVFKIAAYKTSCYAMEIEKEWWADVKWTFGELDPKLIGGDKIGDKIVKEICIPVIKTWTDEIPHYKNCTQETIYNPTNDTTSEAYNYTCLDYIEKINHTNEEVDCIKIGKVNVSGEIYSKEGFWCKLQDTRVCCYPTEVGGEYAITWRTDGSVDRQCVDLITGEKEIVNKLRKGELI